MVKENMLAVTSILTEQV